MAACVCRGTDPHCPEHGIQASLARETEFFSDVHLREDGAPTCGATCPLNDLTCLRPMGHIGRHTARSAARTETRW